jgi:Ferritin-like domain
MIAARRPSRRGLFAGGASMLAAGAFASTAPAFALQADRELLDLLLTQEQIQVVHYSAILDTFDDAAFSAAGLSGSARGDIEAILAAEQAHIAALARPDGGPTPAPAPPALTDLIDALSEAVELENLAVASYAFVIPELDRQRLLPVLIGIHSVEARHAAWLATLLETNPFPEAIDQALTLEQSEANAGEPRDVPPAAGTPGASGDTAWLTAAIADDLGAPPETVQVVSMEPRNWPDTSLGCPQPDMLYAQVVTPGYLVLVDVSGKRIEYHTDERGTVVRCP